MHVDQPIFMNRKQKSSEKIEKISRMVRLEILNRGGVGVEDLSKLGGSALWNEGEGFLKLLKNKFQRSPNLEQVWRQDQT